VEWHTSNIGLGSKCLPRTNTQFFAVFLKCDARQYMTNTKAQPIIKLNNLRMLLADEASNLARQYMTNAKAQFTIMLNKLRVPLEDEASN